MRELKFRAWDKVAKKFLFPYPEGFDILGETTCFDLIGLQLSKRNLEIPTLEKLNDVELMQFTGLKDKNEKEIYESDFVIDDRIDEENIYLIEWSKAGFIADELEDECFEDCLEYLEVCGNKFENPDLLTQEAI